MRDDGHLHAVPCTFVSQDQREGEERGCSG